MNILIINHYAGSPEMGMEFRPYYLAREWVKLGIEVTVIAASYSHLRSKNPECEDISVQMIDGIRYVFLKTPPYLGNGLGRVRNIFAYVRKLRHRADGFARQYCPDAVISSSTYLLDWRPAVKIARLSGAKTCFEIHDIWPLTLQVMGGLSEKNPAMRFLQKREDEILRQADSIVSILPFADIHIKERGVTDFNYHHIPNGIDPEEIPAEPLPEKHMSVLSELKAQGKFILLYAGGHAVSNALEPLIDAAGELDDRFAVVLTGGGAQKEQLMKRAGESGNPRIVFLDSVAKNQVPALLDTADALFLGAKKSPLYRFGVGMNKLFDYMLAAKPIINAVEAPGNPVSLAGCGICVPAEDPAAIAAAARELASMDESSRRKMGELGREYVLEHHNYETLAKRFLEALE